MRRDALRMITGSLGSMQRDNAVGEHAEAVRQHRERMRALYPGSYAAALPQQQGRHPLKLLDGPSDARRAGHARHDNDAFHFRCGL